MVPLVFLVPIAMILWCVWVMLTAHEVVAVLARVWWVPHMGAASIAATSTVALVVASLSTTLVTLLIVTVLMCGRVTVQLGGGRVLGGVGIGCSVVLLEELGEEGDVFGNGMGGSNWLWRIG